MCDEEPPRPSSAIRQSQEVRHSDGTVERLTPESVSQVRDGDPRKLRRRLAGDLDAIVAKAMRKEPDRRYGSVEQLSEDIRRHLRGLPVRAHQGSFTYFAGKFVGRHRLGLGVMLLSLAFAVMTGVLELRHAAENAQREAENAVNLEILAGIAKQVVQKEENSSQQALRFFQDIFQDVNPGCRDYLAAGSPSTGGDQIFALLEKARMRIDRFQDDPEVQAELMSTLVRIYSNLGCHQEARALAEQSLELRRSHYPRTHRELAIGMGDLAAVFGNLGEYELAAEQAEEVWRIFRVASRKCDRHILGVLFNLAILHSHHGAYNQAEELLHQVLETRYRCYRGEGHEMAETLDQLGKVYYAQGDLERAELAMRQVLMLRRDLHTAGHPKIATALNNLARVLLALGHTGEAEEKLRKALAIRRDRLGDDHVSVATTRRNLAEALLARGDVDGAEELVEDALATFLALKPQDDGLVAAARNVLGACWTARGRYGEAEPVLLESYRILSDDAGESAIYTRVASRHIVALYEAWGRLEEAAKYRNPKPPGSE